jgi:ATP-dependent DNA helicase 2 subunit 2
MRRYQEMGEVRFIWAEPDNHNSQIQLSAIVQAMVQKDYVAVVRTVDKHNSPPKIGVCKPVIDADQLHYLYWVQDRTLADCYEASRCLLRKTNDRSSSHP